MALKLCYRVDDQVFCVPIPVLRLKRWWRWPQRGVAEPPPDPWFQTKALGPELLTDLVALSTIVAAGEELSCDSRAHIDAAVARAIEQLSIPDSCRIEGFERHEHQPEVER